MTVAYPGPVGSHSSAAAAAMFPSAELVGLGGFHAVADAVADHEAAHGVLPIESSLAGAIAETHDLLHERNMCSSSSQDDRIHVCERYSRLFSSDF